MKNKIKFSIAALGIYAAALVTPAIAGSIAIGAKGEALYATVTAEERLKGTDSIQEKTHNNYGARGSFFAQYTFMDDGFVIGIEHVPYEASLGKADRLTQDNDKAAGSGTPTVNQHVEAQISDHTTWYIETPGLFGGGEGGLYLKAAYSSLTLNTLENLGTGASYPDQDLDATTVGLGWKGGTNSGILVKIEGAYTDYDSIDLTSTGSDTASTIKGSLDTYSIGVSVGYSF